MKFLGYGLILVVGLLLETAGAPGLSLFGIKPELLSLLTMLFTMIQGPWQGAVFGFCAGLVQDLFIGRYIGLNGFVLMLLAFAIGFITEQLFKENLLVRFAAILGGTALGQILYLLGMAAFGMDISWLYIRWKAIAVTSAVNALLSLGLYKPLAAFDERLHYWHEVLKRTG